MGFREIIRIVEEEKDVDKVVDGKKVTEKKKWSYFELSDYKWWTYKEVGQKVHQAGSALIKAGVDNTKVFNVYSSTSPRWQVIANGKQSTSNRSQPPPRLAFSV